MEKRIGNYMYTPWEVDQCEHGRIRRQRWRYNIARGEGIEDSVPETHNGCKLCRGC